MYSSTSSDPSSRSSEAKLFGIEFSDLHVSKEDSVEPRCDQLNSQLFEAEYFADEESVLVPANIAAIVDSSQLESLRALEQPAIEAVDMSGPENTFYGQSTVPLNDSDQTVLQSAITLILGVLLAMVARPQLVTHGAFTGKRSKRGSEFWTPNIIGRDYRTVTAGPSEHNQGSSPRMHWRRGHWRDQAYGPEHKLRKLLWIEPMLVAAGTPDNPARAEA